MMILTTITVLLIIFSLWAWRQGARYNGADWGGRRINRIDGLIRWLCKRYHRLQAVTIPLPAHGPAIVVANHISGLDPLLMVSAAKRPLRFLIAREQYERWGLTWLFRLAGCIPVDRSGRPEQALREAIRALRAGEVVALFPHGGIHLESAPRKRLKGGVYALSRNTGTPIYPVRIEGIRGQGHTLLAVLMRSRACLYSYDPIHCEDLEMHACLDHLAAIIEGHGVKKKVRPVVEHE